MNEIARKAGARTAVNSAKRAHDTAMKRLEQTAENLGEDLATGMRNRAVTHSIPGVTPKPVVDNTDARKANEYAKVWARLKREATHKAQRDGSSYEMELERFVRNYRVHRLLPDEA